MTDVVSTEAWNRVYAEFHGEMTGVARRLLVDAKVPPSRADAEDIVHTAFAKVLSTPRTVDDPRAYLYAVIRREVLAEAKRCSAAPAGREETRADYGGASAGESAAPDFSDLVVHRIVLHQALRELSPQQRTAVWATKAMGRTQQETAQDLGKSAGTVATHVMRAMTCLKATLVAAAFAGVTLLIGLTGTALVRAVQNANGARGPRDPSYAEPGISSWQAILIGAVLLPAGFALLDWALPRLSARWSALRGRRRLTPHSHRSSTWRVG
ncbi:RNA polymerase sigma factor [Streptomyces brasiliscabiei]|uniref:RNA polymerase sigma factor n=1 Tax=Streptomyces brasiliscabiei TaxID=2736302 RepID=UPI001C102E86|nr:sigma-70 family RNA polymerase sigma factor [Streptomyces brasiliscabiei]